MANAYDVMAMAKRQGAEVKAVEEYDKYMDALTAEEARASKAGMMGQIGGGIGGSIASYLAPAAIGALGIGTGGIGTMLLSGAVGAGISRGGTEIGDFLARQWTMGGKRGKGFKDIGKMGGVSGPYGQRRASELQRRGKGAMEKERNTIAQMLDVENTNRWLSSAMSGLTTAGKVRAGAEGVGLGGKSWKEVMKSDTTIGERMKAAMAGDVGEGYELGAKSTGDWWKKPDFGEVAKISPNINVQEQAIKMWKEGKGGSMKDRLLDEGGLFQYRKGQQRSIGELFQDTGINIEQVEDILDGELVVDDIATWEHQLMNPQQSGQPFAPLTSSESAQKAASSITASPFPWEDEGWLTSPENPYSNLWGKSNLPSLMDKIRPGGLYEGHQSIEDMLNTFLTQTRSKPRMVGTPHSYRR